MKIMQDLPNDLQDVIFRHVLELPEYIDMRIQMGRVYIIKFSQ